MSETEGGAVPPTTDAEVQADRAAEAAKAEPAGPTAEELAEYDRETIRLVNTQERLCQAADAEHEDLKSAAALAKKRAEAEADRLRAMIRERQEKRGKQPERSLLDLVPPAKWRGLDVETIPFSAMSPRIWDKLPKGPLTLGDLSDMLGSFDPAAGPPFGLDMGEVFIIKSQISEIIDAEAEEAEAAQPAAADPELWRQFPIERWTRFGITAKDVEKLAAGEVKRETGRTPVNTVGDLSDFTKPSASGYSRGYADFKGLGKAGADRLSAAEELFWQWWRGGGEVEFAQERGLIRGDATEPGPGSGGTPAGDNSTGEAPAIEWDSSRPALASGPGTNDPDWL
jgi:hypothetical protein